MDKEIKTFCKSPTRIKSTKSDLKYLFVPAEMRVFTRPRRSRPDGSQVLSCPGAALSMRVRRTASPERENFRNQLMGHFHNGSFRKTRSIACVEKGPSGDSLALRYVQFFSSDVAECISLFMLFTSFIHLPDSLIEYFRPRSVVFNPIFSKPTYASRSDTFYAGS